MAGTSYWAMHQVPDFYREALRLAPEKQHRANDELLEHATALASNARREGRWHARFTTDQINGWLAVDLARNFPDLLPKEVLDPRIRIAPDRATIACRYAQGAISTVISLEVDLYVAEPNQIALRIHKVRAGALPIPLSKVLEGLSTAAQDARWQLRWRQTEGDPVALISFPPPRDEDDTQYQLETLELCDGEIYLAGRTLRAGSGPVLQVEPVALDHTSKRLRFHR